jgi:FAD/FMN-containing dehydrogenase
MTRVQTGKIAELKKGFQGEVILPGDSAYEDARKIWNAMIDKRPAVIARCATTPDVIRAVSFARDHGLLLAVRGGGHNIAGSAICDDGLVVDLSRMKAAHVDPARRRATIEGAPRWQTSTPPPRRTASRPRWGSTPPPGSPG